MANGDHGCSYADVRDLNNLESSQVSDVVLEKHLDMAIEQVKKILKTDFSTTATPSFTDTLFNSRDCVKGAFGSVLYLTNFLDYGILQSITSVSYKSSTDASFTTLTEGSEDDYVYDKNVNAIKFNSHLVTDGNQNIKVSGTYGYKVSDMPVWIEQWIALTASMIGLVYVAGGKPSEMNSIAIGNINISKGQYSSNYAEIFKKLEKALDNHLRANGMSQDRVMINIV